eukprot:TRINITY_DN9643_c0_g1_i2.p1 TRINITY_DN9643_c0_g1~~TRINITY_DN9643_c0_g1_i2.p1  ORF type:complete len:330 (-),score=107.39 TRINITY_DN9643_c0_g1_i2:83-1072(-)
MLLRQSQVKLLICAILLFFILSLLSMFQVITSKCNTSSAECSCQDNKSHKHVDTPTSESSDHKLCIIVPFRDRFEELLEFAPYIKTFLNKQAVKNEVWVINQADKFRFNRAYLINVGFQESSPTCDYIAMHDVDLLPQNPDLLYKYPEKGPLHISSNELHPKYDYPTFIGGILLISRKHYKQLDGMSNKYWGWGLEDDEFFVRMRQANMVIEKPKGIRTGRKGTFRHVHSSKERKRDNAKCYNQRNATRRRDRQTGLAKTAFAYNVISKRQLVVDGAPVTFLDIHLECDRMMTPWCNCTGAPPDKNTPDRTRDEDVVVPLLRKNKKTVT